jgi:D-aminopeptidase
VADAGTTERPGGLRDLGLSIGTLPTGPANAITDVGDVAVGHVTVARNEPGPPEGRGVARTGVTAIAPRAPGTLLAAPVPAGAAVLNGAGEMTGFLQVSEWGVIETPVYLTSTMAVGRVFDGAVAAAAEADPAVRDQVVIPVVAECDDSWLNEPIPVQVEAGDAGRALAAATRGPVAQGAVGAGTGMICFGWKGGIGTSSRVVDDLGATVGVLVLANFGAWQDLRIDGVPVGRLLGVHGGEPGRGEEGASGIRSAEESGPAEGGSATRPAGESRAAAEGASPTRSSGVRGPAAEGALPTRSSVVRGPAARRPAAPRGEAVDPAARPSAGSCIAVVATDAALGTAQLARVARRAGLGLARTGSVAHHGSGEIFLAFASGEPDGVGDGRSPEAPEGGSGRPGALPDRDLDPLFAATVDAAEEAVLNALWAAADTTGRDGRVVRALPHAEVVELLTAHRRLDD